MAKTVGLSRPIKMAWLKKTVELQREGLSGEVLKTALNEYLAFEIKSPTNLRKTREILINTWERSCLEYPQIHDLAAEVALLPKLEALAGHWCMLLLAFPVFYDATGLIGKMATIQDTFTNAWLKERIYEQWGERSTLLFSLEKTLQTLRNIDATVSKKPGVHSIQSFVVTEDATRRLILWTILALSDKAYLEPSKVGTQPQFFPFKLDISHEWLHNHEEFSLTSFDGKIVILKG